MTPGPDERDQDPDLDEPHDPGHRFAPGPEPTGDERPCLHEGLRADERHRGRRAERGAVEDVVEPRVAQEHQQRNEDEEQPGDRERHHPHQGVALTQEVEPRWAERRVDVLEQQPEDDAGDRAPPHRETDHEQGLVLVHVDRVQVEQDEQWHQRRGHRQRHREEATERETDDRGQAERERDAEVRHVGVGQLREQARHDVQRPRPLAGRGRELAPTTATVRDRVVVERIPAPHAERRRRDLAVALRARHVAVARSVLGHGRRAPVRVRPLIVRSCRSRRRSG